MSQVGTIKGYHDGASYNLADIYDEKLVEYNILAGEVTGEVFLIDFNRDNIGSLEGTNTSTGNLVHMYSGVTYQNNPDVLTNTKLFVSFYKSASGMNNRRTAIAMTDSSSYPIKNIIPYVKGTNAAVGVALQIGSGAKNLLELGKFNWIPAFQNTDGTYSMSRLPSFEFSGSVFIDFAGNSYYWKPIFSVGLEYSNSPTSTNKVYANFCFCGYTPPYSEKKLLSISNIYLDLLSREEENVIYVRDIDPSTFDSPFHFRLQFFNYDDNPKCSVMCFVNDELYFYKPNNTTSLYSYYAWSNIFFGALCYGGNVKTFTFHCSQALTNFKVSLLTPMIYQTVPVTSNLLIRHNGANCYVPLTTDKSLTSTPCLAVRHNNTNYYSIK